MEDACNVGGLWKVNLTTHLFFRELARQRHALNIQQIKQQQPWTPHNTLGSQRRSLVAGLHLFEEVNEEYNAQEEFR